MYMSWDDITREQHIFLFSSKAVNASAYLLNLDPRNLTFDSTAVAAIKSVIGNDGTLGLSYASVDAAKCLVQSYTIADVGSEPIGCVVNNIVIVFCICIVFGVLAIRFVLSYAVSSWRFLSIGSCLVA